mgnify:CR=1 FL=1
MTAGFRDELDKFEKRDGDVFYITEETKEQLRAIAPFWEHNNLREKGEALLPDEVSVFMETGVFGMEGKLNAGDAHLAVNYGKMLAEGLSGYEQRTRDLKAALDLTDPASVDQYVFYKAVLIVIDAVRKFAKRYAKLAKELAGKEHLSSAGSPMYQNVTIGGQTTDKQDAVNDLSFLVLKSVAQTRLTQPNLTVRYHKNLNKRFFDECVEVMKLGFGMPALNNDEIIIPSFIKWGVKEEDAYNYSAIGCVETAVPGKWGYRCTGMSYINFPRVLLCAMNNGVDMTSGKRFTKGYGYFKDMKSYDELLSAWDTRVISAALSAAFVMAVHPRFQPMSVRGWGQWQRRMDVMRMNPWQKAAHLPTTQTRTGQPLYSNRWLSCLRRRLQAVSCLIKR